MSGGFFSRTIFLSAFQDVNFSMSRRLSDVTVIGLLTYKLFVFGMQL